jgi:putative radical SAM enzyme (TIGR03279 family)
MNNHRISSVLEGSIAHEAGVEPGDLLVAINGEPVRDMFDYGFLLADEQVLLEILKPDGETLQIEIEKDEAEDIGLVFDEPMMDEEKSCRNKCIFCFIDQLPKGMRQSLYYKDDDVRLSFLYGNYVTMTNMNQQDLDRIVRYRMSPVNISVHTTNPELRAFMLKNRSAGDIMSKMKYLADRGILLNAQIVLCRHINDGACLDYTLNDLSALMPNLNSISVVPVGLTRFRQSLPVLYPFDKASAIDVINQVEKWQHVFLQKTGSRKVYLSDEWYLMSGKNLPGYEHYEDFPQIENGVGMAAAFINEFNEALESRTRKLIDRTVSIATGTLARNIINNVGFKAEKHFPGLKVLVYPIENRFFGNTVTVAGLLTGKDLLEQLSGKPLGQKLLLPSNMFKSGTDLLLDDVTIKDLGQSLHVNIIKVDNNGEALLNELIE